jgi:hypothetical protein
MRTQAWRGKLEFSLIGSGRVGVESQFILDKRMMLPLERKRIF